MGATIRKRTPVLAIRHDPTAILDVLPSLLLFILAIGVVVAVVYFARRFLKDWQVAEPENEHTLLARFRELHLQGKLSAEEYQGIVTSLAQQMKRRGEVDESDR